MIVRGGRPVNERRMGPDPSVYAFVKWETHRNIYRIPLHN